MIRKIILMSFFSCSAAYAGFTKAPVSAPAPAPAVAAPVVKEEPAKPAEPAETSFGSDDEDSGLPALKAETKAPAVVTAPAAKAVVVPAPAPKVAEPVKEKTAVASVPVAVEKPVVATAPVAQKPEPKPENKHQVKQAPVQLETGTDDEIDSGSVAAQQAEAARMQAQLDAQVKAMQLQMSGQTKAAVKQANQNIRNMNRAMGAGN